MISEANGKEDTDEHTIDGLPPKPTQSISTCPQLSGAIGYTDQDIYNKIEQSKAVKNDDALADFDIWNFKASEKPLWDKSIETWKMATGNPDDIGRKIDEAQLIVFETLRKGQLNSYKKKVNKSFQ